MVVFGYHDLKGTIRRFWTREGPDDAARRGTDDDGLVAPVAGKEIGPGERGPEPMHTAARQGDLPAPQKM